MSYRVSLQLCIFQGLDLPRADRLSKIDPYVKIIQPAPSQNAYSGTALPGPGPQTAFIDDEFNPIWNESFCLHVTANEEGYMQGLLRLELWDKEKVLDKFCGYSVLDLGDWPVELPLGGYGVQMSLPVEYADASRKRFMKQKRNSRLVVRLVGTILSHEDLMRDLGPSAIRASDSGMRVYMSIEHDRKLFCGLQYAPNAIHFLICLCEKADDLHLDVVYSGEGMEADVTVARRTYPEGRKMFPGCLCYSEAVILGLPLSIDFEHLVVSVEDRKAKDYTPAEELLESVSWPGPTSDFDESADKMQDSGAYADEAGIYIKVEDSKEAEVGSKSKRTPALLKLDYGTGPSEWLKVAGLPLREGLPCTLPKTPGQGPPVISLCVVRARKGRTYDWVNPDQPELETFTTICAQPEVILGGRYKSSYRTQVSTANMAPNVALQRVLRSSLVCYRLRNYQGWSVKSLLNPRGEELEVEEEVAEEAPPAPKSFSLRQIGLGLTDAPGAIFRGIGEGVTSTASRAGQFISGVLSGSILKTGVSRQTSSVDAPPADTRPQGDTKNSERVDSGRRNLGQLENGSTSRRGEDMGPSGMGSGKSSGRYADGAGRSTSTPRRARNS